MNPIRSVVAFDAAELSAGSAFRAGMLDGHVVAAFVRERPGWSRNDRPSRNIHCGTRHRRHV
jgi:hypothetical protein